MNGINSNVRASSVFDNLVHTCKSELEKVSEWHIKHVVREQKIVSDVLAELSRSLPQGIIIVDQPLEETISALDDVVFGVPA